MSDPPKRSRRDIASQLAVILLLIAVLVGAIFVLDKVVTSHTSIPPAPTSKPVYNYSCCTGWNADAVYTPGETVRLHWFRQQITSSDSPMRKITLTAFLSNRFPSDAAFLSSKKSGSFTITSGPFAAAADRITVSNRSELLPISLIRIPGDAKKGYYAIACTSGQKGFSVSSIETIHVI